MIDTVDYKNYELISRKRIVSFLEKTFQYCKYDFRHDLFKQVLLGEIPSNTEQEDMFKNYYDAFVYLLLNNKNQLTSSILMRFFYIIKGTSVNIAILNKISSNFFHMRQKSILDQVLDFHIFIFLELDDFSEEEKFIISLMFLNYSLVKNNIPCVQILLSDFDEYIIARNDYIIGEKDKLIIFLIKLLNKSKYQQKEYYRNLKYLSVDDIRNIFVADKEKLRKDYQIKHIYLFGSFAKDISRLDSDIDLIIDFSNDVSYEEKIKQKEILAEYYYKVFNRFIDITELSFHLNERFLKEVTNIKKIF